jgi:alkylated DNA nucleotide flippase Atl1
LIKADGNPPDGLVQDHSAAAPGWLVLERSTGEIPMVAARTPNVRHAHASPGGKAAEVARRRKRAPLAWEAKLRPELAPRVVADRRHGGRLLLPTPLLVAEAVAAVPRGRVITVGQLRSALAERFDADRTCPLMTGIFAAILAGAVAEDLGQRRKPRWPIWRLVRDDGTLHPKWPLDTLYRATRLREEGVRITHRQGHWAAIDTQHC